MEEATKVTLRSQLYGYIYHHRWTIKIVLIAAGFAIVGMVISFLIPNQPVK